MEKASMHNRRFGRVPPMLFATALAALLCCTAVTARGPVVNATPAAAAQGGPSVPLPNKPDTLHFAVIGDNGTGDRPEYDVAAQLVAWHAKFEFPMVVMMGDN